MVPDTGYIDCFDLFPYQDGLMLLLPERRDPEQLPVFEERKKLFKALEDSTRWGEKLGKPSSYDPNDFFQTGYNTQNTVSVASSSERSQSFVSAGSVNSRGIIPNNEYSRYNFTIRHGRELVKDKLELDTDFFFTKSESQNGVAQGLYYLSLIHI